MILYMLRWLLIDVQNHIARDLQEICKELARNIAIFATNLREKFTYQQKQEDYLKRADLTHQGLATPSRNLLQKVCTPQVYRNLSGSYRTRKSLAICDVFARNSSVVAMFSQLPRNIAREFSLANIATYWFSLAKCSQVYSNLQGIYAIANFPRKSPVFL